MNLLKLRQFAAAYGLRLWSLAISSAATSLMIGLASVGQSQWTHSYSPVETAAPVFGSQVKLPGASTYPGGSARVAATPGSPRQAWSNGTVAYGGAGPHAQLLSRPGQPAVATRPAGRYGLSQNSLQSPAPVPVGYGTSYSGQPLDSYESQGYEPRDSVSNMWNWQIVPEGLIYPTYLAGVKEPRMGAVLNSEANDGVKWDLSIGGRFGVIRYGTLDVQGGEGWQLDVEASAHPRLDPEENMDLEATDYRFGVPVTYGRGRYRMKIGYFHLSSHLGDEFAIRNGLAGRINYSRDAILWGHTYWITDSLKGYFEVGYGAKVDVNEPWDFQFGFDYTPACECGFRGAPFFAANTHLREEVNFGGNAVIQAGWQWRSRHEGHLLRVGVQYYNGKHERYEFFDTSEQKFGLGIWYDF